MDLDFLTDLNSNQFEIKFPIQNQIETLTHLIKRFPRFEMETFTSQYINVEFAVKLEYDEFRRKTHTLRLKKHTSNLVEIRWQLFKVLGLSV